MCHELDHPSLSLEEGTDKEVTALFLKGYKASNTTHFYKVITSDILACTIDYQSQ